MHGKQPVVPGRYFYERADWALRRAMAGPQKPVVAETLPVPGETAKTVPPTTDPASLEQPAEEKPVSADLDEVSKAHQYKKESSSQQAP